MLVEAEVGDKLLQLAVLILELRLIAALFRRPRPFQRKGGSAQEANASALAMPDEAPQHLLKPVPGLHRAVSQAAPESETRRREDGDPDARMVQAEPVADVSGDAAELTEAVQEAAGVPSYDVVGADDIARVRVAAADEIQASLAAEDDAAQLAAVGDGDPAGAGDGPEPGLQPI